MFAPLMDLVLDQTWSPNQICKNNTLLNPASSTKTKFWTSSIQIKQIDHIKDLLKHNEENLE